MMKEKFTYAWIITFLMATGPRNVWANRYNTNENATAVRVEMNQKHSSNLLDPKQREFWREGSHIPDEGFLQLAITPNIQNAKIWLLRNEIKAQRMQVIMKIVDQAHGELVMDGDIQFVTLEAN